MKLSSHSDKQTQRIAGKIAERFKKKGGVIALSGDLGAGKTTFVQGFAKHLGITDRIISPTFVVIRQHQIPGNKIRFLFHVDLYRLENNLSQDQLGLMEIFSKPDHIVVIEWPENLAAQLPENTLFITIKKTGITSREINFISPK